MKKKAIKILLYNLKKKRYMDLFLLGLSFVVFIGYLIYLIKYYGVLKSISHSYSLISEPTLYVLAMFGFALPIMLLSTATPLMIVAGFGILIASATAGGRTKFEVIIHRIGAEVGQLIACISMWLDFNMWYLSVAFVLFAILSLIIKYKAHIWWIEVSAFAMIFIGMILIN